MVPFLPLLSCELSVSVKENPDRKKKKKMSTTFLPGWLLSLKETNCETKKNVFTPKSLFVLEKIVSYFTE